MKFISKILKILYGDLHHFPVPVFDFSTFQKNKLNIRKLRILKFESFKNSTKKREFGNCKLQKIKVQKNKKIPTQTFKKIRTPDYHI